MNVHGHEAATLRYLIVNGDDCGLSPGVTRGILEAKPETVTAAALEDLHHDAVDSGIELSADGGQGLGILAGIGAARTTAAGMRSSPMRKFSNERCV